MARKARRGGGGTSAPRNTLRTGDDCPTHLPRPPKPIASAGRADLATGRGGPASPRGPRPPCDVHRPHSEHSSHDKHALTKVTLQYTNVPSSNSKSFFVQQDKKIIRLYYKCRVLTRDTLWQRTLPVVAWISFTGYTTHCLVTLVSLPTQSVQPSHTVRFDRRGWSRIPTNVQRVISSFTE